MARSLERRRQLGDAGIRDLRRGMGERNRALIRAEFSVERVVDAHAAEYEMLSAQA